MWISEALARRDESGSDCRSSDSVIVGSLSQQLVCEWEEIAARDVMLSKTEMATTICA